jgi:hypothetical protein
MSPGSATYSRDAKGHFREDTETNRRLLIEVASRPENFVGTDRAGNAWFEESLADGTQVWARVLGDKIVNGGINEIPRDSTGLLR